jgi:lysozyme family protein
MLPNVKAMLDELIQREGGYVDDPKDSGGETNFGITVAVARANGYSAEMKAMPRDVAIRIYSSQYWEKPGFASVAEISEPLGELLFDTGVNMGVSTAATFLQRALNVMNNEATLYDDLKIDGQLGQKSQDALRALFNRRGARQAEAVLLRAVNSLRGARYVEICEKQQKNERFAFGWFSNRVLSL